ncbi:TRAP transporter large permease subunit [Aquibium sp. ELW1220]|uniref:TRAP transporter large permease n=1 Tax=Aquibium sp. ELW1220 TaxID=2976766 RepID=UPI0025B26B1E|nr:TRAP transporter large permease subunit [Aquibium sp. ELW1220]MDN2580970.1 TRAP transporter large permease subunit [Aquibium sp. ELW1220]
MTETLPAARMRPAGSGLSRWTLAGTGMISLAAVAGILAGALVICIDVLGRWLFGTSVVALNEIMSAVFAVAIAATLPAGAARRVNLSIDLLGHMTGPRLTAWLKVAGSILLLAFFALLAWRVFGLALRYHAQGRASSILRWPLAPTYFAVSVSMGLAGLVQLVNAVDDVREAIAVRPGWRSSPVVLALVGTLTVFAAATGLWIVVDFDGFSGAVTGHPAVAVILAFLLLWVGVLAQLPLATVTAMIGLVGTLAYVGGPAAANTFASDALDFLRNEQVATLPMFLIMGAFAVVAGVSDDLFRVANAVLGRFRGGLAYATVAGCAGFGAVSGNSIATSATFGRMALPQMKQRGYAPTLSSATVAAGGTLGALVPPSGVIILFALLTEQSIGALFMAAMVPALLAVLLYFAAIFVVLRLDPASAPAAEPSSAGDLPAALRGSLPVAVLFTVVIGGLYGGVFTATESAAVGAVGAFLLALARRRLNRTSMLAVFSEITASTAMIYGLIFGALAFSFFVNLGQTPTMAAEWIASFDARPVVILAALIVFYLLLGSVMDSFAVMVITVPVVTPLVLGLGYDMLFWGVLMLVVVETGMITPPFGMNLFVIKSLQPDVPLSVVMRGVLPFVLADLLKIVLLVAFPALSLWLPSTMN